MTIEEIKEAAKVMEAYANGKKIQCNDNHLGNGEWVTTDNPSFNWDKYAYRIKPESKFRPFKSQEECWNEMRKHADFGWVVSISNDEYLHIGRIYSNSSNNGYGITLSCDEGVNAKFDDMFKGFKFTDGEPFGIREK